jgi:DNA-binding response OmpR family regulator
MNSDNTNEKETIQKPLIMTIDDSPSILESIAAVLGDDYKVFKLPKPTMLTKVLGQVHPDLFLLDYQMPELNGFKLIPIIRALERHKDTPIIFLTAEGTIDNLSAAIGFGVCDFIVKPFNPDQLREKVAKHIRKTEGEE